MNVKLALIAGVAIAALTQSPSISGELASSPKLTIVSVDPASPSVSASRGLQIVDQQTTSAIEPAGVQLALAVDQSDVAEAPRQDVDLSMATGPEESAMTQPVVLASIAPLPTPRPAVVVSASEEHSATASKRATVKRARVELVSDVEQQPRKKRVFRYPGPVLIGVYN